MRVPVDWQWRRFSELTADELYALLAARSKVFVIEQNCSFLDADGYDMHAWHLMGWADEPQVLAAYLRLLEPGCKFAEPSIGRVLTTAAFRNCGLGREAMHRALRQASLRYPGRPVRISAQARLERFYCGMGFRAVSEPYQEDGIVHLDMLRPPSEA
ncbi:MAG: GNAT family N-acetyltransferase [Betaproteobacteria bacterium]|nr:MAG: GNAT family N-acetyltransferase [Betaproteobacteria bacterium]